MTKKTSFPTVPQVKIFTGASYTGKTQNLLLEVDTLLRGKAETSEVLIFCATPSSAQNLSTRLRMSCPHACEVEVTTPRAFFLDLLGTKEAHAETGRKARLLLPFEYDFFLEDLKTSGVRAQRLRELLKFFYKGLSELSDDDEEWLITTEEDEVFNLMKNCLSFTGGILEPELANLAVNYLRNNKGVLESIQKKHVFVDDFHLLSRASQFASCMLAKESLCLSNDSNLVTEAYESYPYLNGTEELIQANSGAVLVDLISSYSCYPAAKASFALRKENNSEETEAGLLTTKEVGYFQLIESESPQDEVMEIAHSVKALLDDGFSAKDIVIAAPHRVWRQNITRYLNEENILAETLPDASFLKSDIRDNGRCFNARFLTLLNLIADPADAVAWRSWCGFGDYLTNSNGMRSLRNVGLLQGKSLDAVLKEGNFEYGVLDGLDSIASTQRIAKAKEEAWDIINCLKELQGQDLLEAIAQGLSGPGAQVPKEIVSLVMAHKEDRENKSGEFLASFIRKHLDFPLYCCDDAVKVTSYENMVGLNPRCLFLAGFMNGFFPKHDYFEGTSLTVEQREKRYKNDLNLIAGVAAKASDILTISFCKKLDLEHAERLKVVINRIHFENNKRIAKTEPSIFLKFFENSES